MTPSSAAAAPSDAAAPATGPRATVLGYLRALGAGTALRPFLADEVLFEAPGRWSISGAAVVERVVRHHYEVEFSARAEVVTLVAEDRHAAADVLFEGVHVGEYDGIAATGREVRVPLAMFFDVEAERIAVIRLHYSPEQVRAQLLGVVPAGAGRAESAS